MKKLFLKIASILALIGVSINNTEAMQSHSLKIPENATWYAAGALALLGASYGLYKAVPLAWSYIKLQNDRRIIGKATVILDELSSKNIKKLSFSAYGTRPIVEEAVDLVISKLKNEATQKQLSDDFVRMYGQIRRIENDRIEHRDDLAAAQSTIQEKAKAIKRQLKRADSF